MPELGTHWTHNNRSLLYMIYMIYVLLLWYFSATLEFLILGLIEALSGESGGSGSYSAVRYASSGATTASFSTPGRSAFVRNLKEETAIQGLTDVYHLDRTWLKHLQKIKWNQETPLWGWVRLNIEELQGQWASTFRSRHGRPTARSSCEPGPDACRHHRKSCGQSPGLLRVYLLAVMLTYNVTLAAPQIPLKSIVQPTREF